MSHCVVTSREVRVNIEVAASGASWGTVEDTKTLIEAAQFLQTQHHCSALAVVVRFPEDNEIESKSGLNSSGISIYLLICSTYFFAIDSFV